ncbi:hypothetical protein [Paenisporosarcina cavernae]|uniref:ParB/Sulfiredoxin domain-containing protein n=1 Tax=Paenisporosarcina cavernae TaxID=2320858 RepID=A0A385YVT2_9BACL|nr:hypothetical protein [Paenisporosarcina cavernae]AYC29997.1 hypothetical protein D3873_08980 [Paenisporosarcina cavernae]
MTLIYEKPKHRDMNTDILQLFNSNPRFPHEVTNEIDAILAMLKLKRVGPNKIKNLIIDIFESEVVLEDFIVLEKDGNYIVFDGNRRLTAIKLFKDENLEIIREIYKDLYSFIINLKNIKDISTLIVSAKVYTDEESARNHVRKLHSGEQDGVGQIHWSSIEKDNFDDQGKITFKKLLLSKLKNDDSKKYLYDQIVKRSISTTIERFFGFSSIKTRIFRLKRGEEISLTDKIVYEKVCEMIEYFLLKNGTVTDVYLRENATSFFENINPIGQVNSAEEVTATIVGDGVNSDKEDLNDSDIKKDTDDIKPDSNPEKENNEDEYKILFDLNKNFISIREYQDYDLSRIIKVASDSNGENLISKVSFIHSGKKLISNTFSGDAQPGRYNIQARIENNSIVKSHSVVIEVERYNYRLTTRIKKNNDLFTPISSLVKGNVVIDISEVTNNIISEITSLEEPEKYPHMIASSVRQLIERSIDLLITNKSLNYSKANTKSIIEILDSMNKDNKLLEKLVQGDNKMSFQETQNLISHIDNQALVSYLHLIAHNSSHTFYNELKEVINKKITPYLILIHNYLKLTD